MEAILDTLPGKRPLIKLSYRPPNCETPIEHLGTDITPNDASFVRYHLSDIPQVDARTRKLAIGGDGANGEIRLGLDDLKRLTPVEVVALCQCSGNRRGLMPPHVAGVEWAVNTPVTEMAVNSLITSHVDSAMVKVGAPVTVAGIAWDGGYGMSSVEVSVDG